MNKESVGERIAEKLRDDGLLFRTMGMESLRLAQENDDRVAALIDQELSRVADTERLDYLFKTQHRVPVSGTFYFNRIPNGKMLSRATIDAARGAEKADLSVINAELERLGHIEDLYLELLEKQGSEVLTMQTPVDSQQTKSEVICTHPKDKQCSLCKPPLGGGVETKTDEEIAQSSAT